MSTFAKDLAEGKVAERRMSERLQKAGMYSDIKLIEGKFLFYDAVATTPDGKEERLEFKSDRKSALTGNFFVEFWCRDKHSGIAATLADYYVVETFNPAATWKIPVERLLRLTQGCRVVSGGDDNVAQGYLLSVGKIPAEYKLCL